MSYTSFFTGSFDVPLYLSTGTTTSQVSESGPSYLAVQFTSGGETHNGWVELSYDPVTAAVTCINTGYQECSIEDAIANTGDASLACISTGEATNMAACVAEPPPITEIPTMGEWGLMILGLFLSILGVLGIKQQQEEESAVNVHS